MKPDKFKSIIEKINASSGWPLLPPLLDRVTSGKAGTALNGSVLYDQQSAQFQYKDDQGVVPLEERTVTLEIPDLSMTSADQERYWADAIVNGMGELFYLLEMWLDKELATRVAIKYEGLYGVQKPKMIDGCSRFWFKCNLFHPKLSFVPSFQRDLLEFKIPDFWDVICRPPDLTKNNHFRIPKSELLLAHVDYATAFSQEASHSAMVPKTHTGRSFFDRGVCAVLLDKTSPMTKVVLTAHVAVVCRPDDISVIPDNYRAI